MIATPPPPSFGARLTGIEGLRAIAAFSILVSHVWLYTSPGGGQATLGVLDLVLPDLSLGVTLFFALSGFLLYRPFAASVVRAQPMPRVSEYLRNRALRILPAYWVILLLVAVVLDAFLVRD